MVDLTINLDVFREGLGLGFAGSGKDRYVLLSKPRDDADMQRHAACLPPSHVHVPCGMDEEGNGEVCHNRWSSHILQLGLYRWRGQVGLWLCFSFFLYFFFLYLFHLLYYSFVYFLLF